MTGRRLLPDAFLSSRNHRLFLTMQLFIASKLPSYFRNYTTRLKRKFDHHEHSTTVIYVIIINLRGKMLQFIYPKSQIKRSPLLLLFHHVSPTGDSHLPHNPMVHSVHPAHGIIQSLRPRLWKCLCQLECLKQFSLNLLSDVCLARRLEQGD